jgi:hypothetical protein
MKKEATFLPPLLSYEKLKWVFLIPYVIVPVLKMSFISVAICFWIICLTNVLSESVPPDASKKGRTDTSAASDNENPSANNSHNANCHTS